MFYVKKFSFVLSSESNIVFTTRTPAVPDVLVSGRNDEPYARHGVYISGDCGGASRRHFAGHLLFL